MAQNNVHYRVQVRVSQGSATDLLELGIVTDLFEVVRDVQEEKVAIALEELGRSGSSFQIQSVSLDYEATQRN